MTLIEYIEELPEFHRARKEFNELRTTIGLLNSMVNCGEQHSERSQEQFDTARSILRGET